MNTAAYTVAAKHPSRRAPIIRTEPNYAKAQRLADTLHAQGYVDIFVHAHLSNPAASAKVHSTTKGNRV